MDSSFQTTLLILSGGRWLRYKDTYSPRGPAAREDHMQLWPFNLETGGGRPEAAPELIDQKRRSNTDLRGYVRSQRIYRTGKVVH